MGGKVADTAKKSGAHAGMGGRLRGRRGELAMSQRDLSEASGVSADVIVKLEHDARRPRPSTVRRLAGALGVSAEYLTTGRGSVLPGAAGSSVRGKRPKVEVRVSGEPDNAAAGRLERMFERWMEEDEASGEPDLWPEIARAIDQDRTSYRKLFERG